MNVISIGGASRSGSTLLALLLGQIEGCFVVGELRYVWTRGYAENWLCGCGSPFRDCTFWRDVFKEAYGGVDRVPLQEVTYLHGSVAGISRLPMLLSSRRRPAFSRRVADYVSHLDRLSRAIRVVASANTIIDSSKLPSYCYLLSLLPAVDYTGIQLVRDSRAVAFSFMKKRRRPDVPWREDYMVRFSPAKSAIDWNALNLAMELVRRKLGSGAVLRYEDFVRDPVIQIAQVLPSLAPDASRLLSNKETRLTTNHTVSGNPVRMGDGAVSIREDIEWQSSMRSLDRFLVTSLTWPLLFRYGYLGSQRKDATAEQVPRADGDAVVANPKAG